MHESSGVMQSALFGVEREVNQLIELPCGCPTHYELPICQHAPLVKLVLGEQMSTRRSRGAVDYALFVVWHTKVATGLASILLTSECCSGEVKKTTVLQQPQDSNRL